MPAPASIVHLDADAFFASVEQAADPRLRGRPIAVGGDRRGIIAAASYEARRQGVYTPMPTARARRLCPGLVVLPGDYEKYEQFSRWMFSYAYDFTPSVEVASIDEGYADLSQARCTPLEAAQRLRSAIAESLKISVSQGIASCKVVSQIASKLEKPGVFRHVPPGGEARFLAPLRTRVLPGIGPVTARQLDAAGLCRLGQLAAAPEDALALLLGRRAPEIRAFAAGIDPRPVTPLPPPARSYSRQETFAEDLTDPARAEAVLRRLAIRLMERVRRDGCAIRTLALRLRYNDFQEDRQSESLPEPTDLETDLFGRLRPLLRRTWRRRVSLRMIALRFSHIYRTPAPRELALDAGARQRESSRRAARVMDSLQHTHRRRLLVRGCELPPRPPAPPARPRPARPRPARSPRRAAPADGPPPPLLHVHSVYSFLDSTLPPDRLVDQAKALGWEALALTDTGNLHGALAFGLAARHAGLRPLLGAEIQLDGKPLLLYPETRRGYAALCRLLTQGSTFTRDNIPSDTTDLVAIGADPRAAGLFPGAFYLGVATASHAQAFEQYGLPLAAVPPVHFLTEQERPLYDIVQSIRTRTLRDHPDPRKRSPARAGPLLSPAELTTRFTEVPRALDGAREVAARARFVLEPAPPQFPPFVPPDGSAPGDFLRARVLEGLRMRYAHRAPHIRPQVEQELAIIHEVGYESYFLIVWSLLQACRERGIPWLTRGSAADSLVCYCLGISSICPRRFDLYFQRFLNPERMKMRKLPDIDIDFPHDARERVLALIFERYGPDHAAIVGGFSTYQARSALADAAKVLGLSEQQIRACTRHLPRTSAADLPGALQRSPGTAPAALQDEPYATALRVARHLDGAPRHAKMHPCGVILSRDPITTLTPCFRSASGYPTSHFDMDTVEALGLIKFDILGQGGLAVIRDAETALRARGVSPPPRDGEPWRDPAVWGLIAAGRARAVHHIESPAMINLARMCQARDIDTLTALVSVIRPGAANQNRKQAFARRHQGLESAPLPHPSLAPCLAGTYGLIVFEEQVLQICDAFAGLGPGLADRLRRALVKDRAREIDALRPPFEEAARARGHDAASIDAVWNALNQFRGYAFCKAHSAAYAVEAYRAAWLKHYHPAEFLAAVLTHGKGFYRPLVYVLEAYILGIRLAPPTLQAPGPAFVALPGTPPRIRVPATRAKGLRDETRQRLVEEAARAPFLSVDDLAHRTGAQPEELEVLLRIGALDPLSDRCTDLFWAIQRRRRAPSAAPGEKTFEHHLLHEHGETWLPAARGPDPDLRSEPDTLQRLQWETELLDFPVRGLPFDLFPRIPWGTYCPLDQLHQFRGQRVTCCGLVVESRVTAQQNGQPMKFLTLADPTGMAEAEIFAACYRRYAALTLQSPVLEIEATVEPFENQSGQTLRVLRVARPRRTRAPVLSRDSSPSSSDRGSLRKGCA